MRTKAEGAASDKDMTKSEKVRNDSANGGLIKRASEKY
jgi:hypothetical protein